MNRVWALPFLLLSIYVLSSCNNSDEAKAKRAERKVERQERKEEKKQEIIIPISYHRVIVNKESISQIKEQYDSSEMKIILAINRVDNTKWQRLDTLIVPDTFLSNYMAYAPFPKQISSIEKVDKMILYSQSIQAFGAYENGQLVRWGPISTGKKATPTPSRLYHTNWRSKKTVSTIDDEWIMEWYFNLGNFSGVSMHQYEMPGYPASHACVRLYKEDAIWFYDWCRSWVLDKKGQIAAYGTPTLVFGDYPFGERMPWRNLPENKDAIKFTEGQLNKELEPLVNTILERQAVRDSFETVKIKA